MAAIDAIAPTTDAAPLAAISQLDGTKYITVGLRAGPGIPVAERVGAQIFQEVWVTEGPSDLIPARDERGRLLILTQTNPILTMKAAGAYYVSKPATTQAIGVWADTGA